MKTLLNFVKYNNLVPIAVSFVLLGAGGAYAAQNPESIYAESQEVVGVDNTYLVQKDLSAYTPRVQIIGVQEDEEYYYVGYAFYTIDLETHVWKDVVKQEVMKVSKADLGPYRDLGVYVTGELRHIAERELSYLKNAQEKERRQVSVAYVSTTYGGLIGRFLDTTTEELAGYVPVVVAPKEEYGNSNTTVGAGGTSSVGGATSAGSTPRATGLKIGIQVLGNNPARIPLGSSYADLGAVLIDPYRTNLGVYVYMNGARTDTPIIDTSTTTSYAIEYKATDPSGVELVARRIVLVGDAPDTGGAISEVGNTNPTPVAPAPEPAPEPETTLEETEPEEVVPEPEPVVSEPEPAASSTEPEPEPAAPEPEPAPVADEHATSTEQ